MKSFMMIKYERPKNIQELHDQFKEEYTRLSIAREHNQITAHEYGMAYGSLEHWFDLEYERLFNVN